MIIFNNWLIYIILYLIFAVIFNQCYKVITNIMKKEGALTILMQLFAGLFSLLMIPLFKMKISTNLTSYIFLFCACIFYALNDRISITVRQELKYPRLV